MRIFLSKGLILWILSIAIGGFLLSWAARDEQQYSNAKNLSELEAGSLREGDLIVGDISDLLVLHINTELDTYDTSVCCELTALPFSYMVYNVPVKNGKYLRVMISSASVNQELQQRTEAIAKGSGFGEGIHIEGKLVANEVKLNREWYAMGDPPADPNQVIVPFLLKEANIRPDNSKLFAGITVLVIGLLLFALDKYHGITTVDVDERKPAHRRHRYTPAPYSGTSYHPEYIDPMHQPPEKSPTEKKTRSKTSVDDIIRQQRLARKESDPDAPEEDSPFE